MYRFVARSCVAVIVSAALSPVLLSATLGEDQAKHAAMTFGVALTRADASLLEPLLPRRGKVRMRLMCFGPEDGAFGGNQVEALIKDFLRRGVVQSFELLRLEWDGAGYALAHGRASVIDREGNSTRVDFRLTFEPEDDRWVLREIRESLP